jgi:hypothetical protein
MKPNTIIYETKYRIFPLPQDASKSVTHTSVQNSAQFSEALKMFFVGHPFGSTFFPDNSYNKCVMPKFGGWGWGWGGLCSQTSWVAE